MKLYIIGKYYRFFVHDEEGRIAELSYVNEISATYSPNGMDLQLNLKGVDIITVESEKDIPFPQTPEKKPNVRKRRMQL